MFAGAVESNVQFISFCVGNARQTICRYFGSLNVRERSFGKLHNVACLVEVKAFFRRSRHASVSGVIKKQTAFRIVLVCKPTDRKIFGKIVFVFQHISVSFAQFIQISVDVGGLLILYELIVRIPKKRFVAKPVYCYFEIQSPARSEGVIFIKRQFSLHPCMIYRGKSNRVRIGVSAAVNVLDVDFR